MFDILKYLHNILLVVEIIIFKRDNISRPGNCNNKPKMAYSRDAFTRDWRETGERLESDWRETGEKPTVD